jgi:hypothetical protein
VRQKPINPDIGWIDHHIYVHGRLLIKSRAWSIVEPLDWSQGSKSQEWQIAHIFRCSPESNSQSSGKYYQWKQTTALFLSCQCRLHWPLILVFCSRKIEVSTTKLNVPQMDHLWMWQGKWCATEVVGMSSSPVVSCHQDFAPQSNSNTKVILNSKMYSKHSVAMFSTSQCSHQG